MRDYEDYCFEQEQIEDALREIGYALDSIKRLDLEDVKDALKEAREGLENRSCELEKQMHEAKREEARRGEYGYLDGMFAETRQSKFFKEYGEV